MEAAWAKDPKEVDEDACSAFCKFVAHAFDELLGRLHFRAGAPLEVKALFYTPSFHSEKFGMARMEPGVPLCSCKALIESQSPGILPEWMRFVKGAAGSEGLPLSISREKPQGFRRSLQALQGAHQKAHFSPCCHGQVHSLDCCHCER